METISNFFMFLTWSNLLSADQWLENSNVITIQKGACEIYDSSRGAIPIVQISCTRWRSKAHSLAWWLKSRTHHDFGIFATATWILVDWRLSNRKYGDWSSLNCHSFPSLWRMCCRQTTSFSFPSMEVVENKNCPGAGSFQHLWADKPSSNGGKRYLITSIDDYTRKTWVYFFAREIRSF